MQKTITLNPGEEKSVAFQVAAPSEPRAYQVSVDGLSGSFSVIEAPPPPALELVEAHFDSGAPMTKKPGDTFTVTLKIKNNLTEDSIPNPNYLWFGFGQGGGPKSVVSESNLVTGELFPEMCATVGRWPRLQWPVIPAGTTKIFQTTFALCHRAAQGIYDGYISIELYPTATIVIPNILTIVWPTSKLSILGARLYDARWGPRRLGGYAIFGKVDVTITNNEGKTLTGQSPDYVDLQVTILRASDRGQCGFVRFSRDIPPGTNTITLDPEHGWGVSEVTLSPGTFNYILKIKVGLLGWPGNPYIEAEFPGTTVLG